MDINKMTLGEIKEIAALFNSAKSTDNGLCGMIGEKMIIRTYSAGVWFGVISEKSGNEVIVKNARRLWRWQAKESISLSAVAIHGIDHNGSKVCAPVDNVWLEAIELIACSDDAVKSIEGAENVKAS